MRGVASTACRGTLGVVGAECVVPEPAWVTHPAVGGDGRGVGGCTAPHLASAAVMEELASWLSSEGSPRVEACLGTTVRTALAGTEVNPATL